MLKATASAAARALRAGKGAVQLPTLKKLNEVLDSHANGGVITYSKTKPKGAVAGSVRIQEAMRGAPEEFTAHVLKSDPDKVYFEIRRVKFKEDTWRPGYETRARPTREYFGPVSLTRLPR